MKIFKCIIFLSFKKIKCQKIYYTKLNVNLKKKIKKVGNRFPFLIYKFFLLIVIPITAHNAIRTIKIGLPVACSFGTGLTGSTGSTGGTV